MNTAEEIKASDLVLLMGVVGAATRLYNALEAEYKWTHLRPWSGEFEQLGAALREMGVEETDGTD